MKVLAIIDADLETTPLGTVSRQADELRGQPVLRRTVERVLRAKRLDEVAVVCPGDQFDRCRNLLGDMNVSLRASAAGPPPYRRLIATARKWSLDGWRGGMGGAAAMDEYANTAVLAKLAEQAGADAVWTCSGAAAIVDPVLIDAMIEHYQGCAEQMRLVFAPVPPGLAGTVFETKLLAELATQHSPPGWTMVYKPDVPQIDLAFKDCCHPCPAVARHAAGRLIADTRRAFETLADLLTAHPDPDAETAGRWLLERAASHVPPLPREVEIELTTEDQFPNTPLRPRGRRVPKRGPIDPKLIASVAAQLAVYDDSLVVLGGFGEPLLHPQFADIIRILRDAGVYGIAVRSNGVALDERIINGLIANHVDVLAVLLDAWTDGLYRRLHEGHDLAPVTEALAKLARARAAAKQVQPLVIPHLTKATDNLDELDDFFDGWIRRVGWAIIEGFSHHAGQLEDRSVYDMSPPVRTPCRLRTRALILADGQLTLCDQDFKALTSVGSVADTSLAGLWRSPAFDSARRHHATTEYDRLPLCPACNEWHRP